MSKEKANYEGDEKICINCKWFKQSKNCCVCSNPKQTNKKLKEYTYWPFTCKLFEDRYED